MVSFLYGAFKQRKPNIFSISQHSKVVNKTKVLGAGYHAKLPGHTPLSKPKATPQPSSPKQASKHSQQFLSTRSLLSHVKIILWFTLKPRSLLSRTLTIIQLQVHPVDDIQKARCFPTDWNGGPNLFPLLLSQQVSQGHTISPSAKAAPFLITKACLDSIKFRLMLQQLG